MTALTTSRQTPYRTGDTYSEILAAGAKLYAGALVMRNADGNVLAGAEAANMVGVGRAEALADNTTGDVGDVSVQVKIGSFSFANSAGGDLIGDADVGSLCYIVDDQTVAKTDNGGARSPAGHIEGIDERGGVWVRFDEALTLAAV